MSSWLIIIGICYAGVLIYLSLRSRKTIATGDDFMMGGSKIGLVLGFMTFAATLFSTFTLMGMPDFSRTHGVGAWIFLAFSDAIMVFVVIGFGFYLRQRVGQRNYNGMSALLQEAYGNKGAGYLYFINVFLFLIPYVAIQIRGVAIFLVAAFPSVLPAWGWSVLIVLFMLIYSELGGLKAIIYADFMQGTLLLLVVWFIAISCLDAVGGWYALFEKTAATQKALLATPGPKGLLTPQFLIASCIAIAMIPITQPQLSTRLVIMKDYAALRRMAVAVGTFAMLVILPTIIIGLYGAINYPTDNAATFLSNVLLHEQPHPIAAFTIIGLFAAAMSTSDSQLFALGNEIRGIFNLKNNLKPVRITIMVFALAALFFSVFSSDQLVLLARLSFSGTALMGPLILLGLFSPKPVGQFMIYASAIALGIYILSQLNALPQILFGLRLDLSLFIFLGFCALGNFYSVKKRG